MDGLMDGWIDGWMNGWVGGWVDRLMICFHSERFYQWRIGWKYSYYDMSTFRCIKDKTDWSRRTKSKSCDVVSSLPYFTQHYDNLKKAVILMYRENGIRTFYRGIIITFKCNIVLIWGHLDWVCLPFDDIWLVQ
jgi:hypothetical protein